MLYKNKQEVHSGKRIARLAASRLDVHNYRDYGIVVEAVASGGRGGQGVNTSNSKAVLKADIFAMRPIVAPLTEAELEELIDRLRKDRVMNDEGKIVIMSQEERSWHQNRQLAFAKLREKLLHGLRDVVMRDIEPPKYVQKKIARARRAQKQEIGRRKEARKKMPYGEDE